MDAFLDLFNQYSRRLATLASIVFVVLMSLSVANTALFFVRNLDGGSIGPSVVDKTPGASKSDHVNLSELNLFGKVQKAAPVAVEAPETNLNLELQGVFTAANPEDSTAIIAESNKSGKLYQIGDRLPGNALLKAVFDDHILIKRGDRLEKLMFSNAKLAKQPFGARPATAPQVYRPPNALNSPTAIPSNRLQELRARIEARRREIAERSRQNTSPGATIRDYVQHFHDEIRSNPREVLNKLGVSPVASGKADGYRIGGNVPQQMLAQAGLQQGDVILSVNGTPVGNVSTDSSLVDQVLAAGRARVEVQRGERKFFLTVPIPKSQ